MTIGPSDSEELPSVPRENHHGAACCLHTIPPGRSGALDGACGHLLRGQALCVAFALRGISSAAKGTRLGQGEPFNLTHLEKSLYYLPWWYSSVTDTLKTRVILIHSCPQGRWQKGMPPASCRAMGEQRRTPVAAPHVPRMHSKRGGRGASCVREDNRQKQQHGCLGEGFGEKKEEKKKRETVPDSCQVAVSEWTHA